MFIKYAADKDSESLAEGVKAILDNIGNDDSDGEGSPRDPGSVGLSPVLTLLAALNGGGDSSKADEAYEKGSQAADKMSDLIRKHLANPEFKSNTEIPRSGIPVGEIDDATLRAAGFVPSYIAVPEIGQTELRTWRHPFNNAHLHRHGDRYLMHVDNYQSPTMKVEGMRQISKAGLPEPKRSFWDKVKEAALGFKHVVQEGLPGWVSYGTGAILGDKGIGYKDERSFGERVPRAAVGLLAAAGALAGASRLATNWGSKSWNIPESAAAVAAFTGSRKLMDALYDKGVDDKVLEPIPTWTSTFMLGAAPLLLAAGSYAGVHMLREDAKAQDEQQQEQAADAKSAKSQLQGRKDGKAEPKASDPVRELKLRAI